MTEFTTITTDSELTIPGFRERAQDAQSSVNVVCEQPKIKTGPKLTETEPVILTKLAR